MNDGFKIIGIIVVVVLGIVGIIAMAFALEVGGLQWKSYFGPKHADVERKTFEKTRSFNEGKKQELIRYRLEYVREDDPVAREAILSTVRMAFADYNEEELDGELREFLWIAKYGERRIN